MSVQLGVGSFFWPLSVVLCCFSVQMIDCPGLYDTSKTQQEISVIIVQAVACMHPGPNAILYVIRLGRFTAEEYGVFQRLKALFDENVVRYMILLFTGGDDLEKEGKTLSDLMQHAPKKFIQVIEECGHRCIVFNNKAKNTKPQVEELLKLVRKMNEENNHVPYECPKYSMIGEGLEKEVNKRLAEVNKKDPEREKYVQELEAKTRENEETLKMLEEEIRRKDLKRERELEELKARPNREAEERRKKLEADKEKSSTAKEQEIKSFAEIIRLQQETFKKQMEEARERDRLELEQRERERRALEEKRLAAEREERERKERAYREEMRRMKEGIAKNEEQGWVDWAAGGVVKVVAAPFKLVGSLLGW